MGLAASPRLLNGRAWYVTISAVNAAIPRLGFQHRPAALAVIEKLTGVGWQQLAFLVFALRTGDDGVGAGDEDCTHDLTCEG